MYRLVVEKPLVLVLREQGTYARDFYSQVRLPTSILDPYNSRMNFRVDNLQYCNWSREIFEINHQAKLDAVHATICYHEDFDELQLY